MRSISIAIFFILAIVVLAVGFNLWTQAARSVFAPATQAPQPVASQAPQAAVPPSDSQPKPAADTSIRNFTAVFKGRTVEGGFDAGEQHVDYIYRLKRVDVENGRLKTTGDIEYTMAGERDVVTGVTARLLSQGARCEQVQLDTDAFRIPRPALDVPAQNTTVDTTIVQSSDPQQMQMFCQLTQLVQNNPNNPLLGALVEQINRGL